MIKYQYALNKNNNIIHIDDVLLENKSEIFTCISCSNILIPKMGDIRQKHFAHKIKIDCSKETYLHKLGKKIFIDEYSKCIKEDKPFMVVLPINKTCNRFGDSYKLCNFKDYSQEYNLVKDFKKITEEKTDSGFKPDILLENENGEKLYIEINVSHKASKNKIDSGNRIIEIQIKNENDLSIILSRYLNFSDSKIKLFNFKKEVTVKEILCKSNCILQHQTFILYKSGRSYIETITLDYMEELSKKNIIQLLKFNNNNLSREDFFKSELRNALNSDYNVKNCFLCIHHTATPKFIDNSLIFCKDLKKTCNYNNAAECSSYKIDSEKLF